MKGILFFSQYFLRMLLFRQIKTTICHSKVAVSVFLLIILSGADVSGQIKVTYNWAFGYGGGLTWDPAKIQNNISATGAVITGTPDEVLSGLPGQLEGVKMITGEGCFSYSDRNGNLLFYSDGMRVWNRNNEVMPNGSELLGHWSSAQSGVVFPYPGSSTRYIAISIEDWGGSGTGLSNGNFVYSIINMDLDGGKGDIETQYKNIRFLGKMGHTSESVSAVKHSNGRDFWIVAPGRDATYTNAGDVYMNVYRVDEGVGVVSATPHTTMKLPVDPMTAGPGGYLRFSPDGKYFVWGTRSERVIFGEFDASAGTFSNVKNLDTGRGADYGVSFSVSGNYLYLAGDGGHFRAYDFHELLGSTDPNTVTPIKVWTSGESGFAMFGMQLGPDGRLYIAASGSGTLMFIDNPEDPYNMKLYRIPDYLTGTVEGSISGTSAVQTYPIRYMLGVPNFPDYLFFELPLRGDEDICKDQSGTYTIDINQNSATRIGRIEWDFGDDSPVVSQNVTGPQTFTQNHTFTKTGNFNLRVIPYLKSGEVDTQNIATLEVVVNPCVIPVNPNIHAALPVALPY